MIHFSKNNPFAFVWSIKFGLFCKKQVSSPTFKTHIYGEEEWSLYYFPKVEDGILDRLVLKRALMDKSQEHIAINYKMEMVTYIGNPLSSGELQGDFNRGGYRSWDIFNDSFENLSCVSQNDLTINIYIWGFSSENEISRILAQTEVEEESASILWKIEGFSSDVFENRLFSLPTTSAYRLTFEMNDKENAKLTFHQTECACEGPLYLNVSAFCLDDIGRRNTLVKAEYNFDRTNKTWKISPFIKRCLLYGEKSLLVNNVLTLYIKLIAQTGRSKESIVEYQYGPQLPDEVYEIEDTLIPPKRKSFSILQRDFLSLYNNKNMTDVTFQIGEKSLQAHKCVLTARSAVFCAMFEQQMLENVNNTVDIQDIDYDTFDSMLRFLYDAVLPNLDFEAAKDLMIASDKYQILSLKEECVEFLKSNINDGNVCEILMLSDMLNDEKLKLCVIEFIKPNKKSFLKSSEWKELTRNNRILATEVLTSLVMDE